MKNFLAKQDLSMIIASSSLSEYNIALDLLKLKVDITSKEAREEFKKLSEKLLSSYTYDLPKYHKNGTPLAHYCSFSQHLASQSSCENLFRGWASASHFKDLFNLNHMRGNFCTNPSHTMFEQLIKDSVIFNNWNNFNFLLSMQPHADTVKNCFLTDKFSSTPGLLTAKLFKNLIDNNVLTVEEQEAFRIKSKINSPQHYINIEQIYLDTRISSLPSKEKDKTIKL